MQAAGPKSFLRVRYDIINPPILPHYQNKPIAQPFPTYLENLCIFMSFTQASKGDMAFQARSLVWNSLDCPTCRHASTWLAGSRYPAYAAQRIVVATIL